MVFIEEEEVCVEMSEVEAEDTVTPNSPDVVGEVRRAMEDDCSLGCPEAFFLSEVTVTG